MLNLIYWYILITFGSTDPFEHWRWKLKLQHFPFKNIFSLHKLKLSFPRFLPRPLVSPCSLFHTSSGEIAFFLYLIALGPAELTLPVWKKMQLPVETPCLIQSHLTSVFILKSDANSQINNEKRSQEGAVSNWALHDTKRKRCEDSDQLFLVIALDGPASGYHYIILYIFLYIYISYIFLLVIGSDGPASGYHYIILQALTPIKCKYNHFML